MTDERPAEEILLSILDRQLAANEVIFAMLLTLSDKVGKLLEDADRVEDLLDLRNRLQMSSAVLRQKT